jgi:hypothetical protein
VQIENIAVLTIWGMALFSVWSALAILLTGLLILLPALPGWWRMARFLCALLAAVLACLWIMAIFRVPTGLPLPTRPRAGVVVWPIMAIWPVIAAILITRHHPARAAPVEPPGQGQA